MKRCIRQSFCLALVLAVWSCSSVPANAWGASGHRIVAIIAERHLKPQARQRIAEILGQNVSLASVANYADAVRNRRKDTSNYHFVDIPITRNPPSYDAAKDCKADAEKGDCLIAALERYRKLVVKTNEPLADRRFALKFIVHLVGDMHQPLHCADNNDRGGNDVKVKWFGRNANLHKVWDTLIIQEAELEDQEFADALDSDLTDQQILAIQQGTFIKWAEAAHKLARSNAYDIPNNKELDQEYYDANALVVDEQLLRGGLRLARVLNQLFAP